MPKHVPDCSICTTKSTALPSLTLPALPLKVDHGAVTSSTPGAIGSASRSLLRLSLLCKETAYKDEKLSLGKLIASYLVHIFIPSSVSPRRTLAFRLIAPCNWSRATCRSLLSSQFKLHYFASGEAKRKLHTASLVASPQQSWRLSLNVESPICGALRMQLKRRGSSHIRNAFEEELTVKDN